MPILPDMSTVINTSQTCRSWLDANLVELIGDNHVLCRLTHQTAVKVPDTNITDRWFYDLISCPYVDADLNKQISTRKTSVYYTSDQIKSMQSRWNLAKIPKNLQVFCRFVVVDGRMATLSVALPANRKQVD